MYNTSQKRKIKTMKTKSLLLTIICLLTLSVVFSSYITKEALNNSRTEEYAIVQSGKRKFIRVTKGTEPTTESEWKKEKTNDSEDYTPVVKVLNQLN